MMKKIVSVMLVLAMFAAMPVFSIADSEVSFAEKSFFEMTYSIPDTWREGEHDQTSIDYIPFGSGVNGGITFSAQDIDLSLGDKWEWMDLLISIIYDEDAAAIEDISEIEVVEVDSVSGFRVSYTQEWYRSRAVGWMYVFATDTKGYAISWVVTPEKAEELQEAMEEIISGITFSDDVNKETEVVKEPGVFDEETVISQSDQKEPVIGVEVTRKNPPISNFSYHIYDDTVVLERYKGNDEVVDIFPTYEIDSVTYKTDLSEFMIGLFNHTAKTVIFEEGITEVYGPVFNSCDVQSVYFPLSMELVYDNTLSYLSPETGRIKIYYAGTQKQWANIFTEYTRTLVSEAEFGGEMGTALADAVNDKFGSSYDSSEFAYYFESSPDDLR